MSEDHQREHHRPRPQHPHRPELHQRKQDPALVRFARDYGWRAYAIPVLIVITGWVIMDLVVPSVGESSTSSTSSSSTVVISSNPTISDKAQSETTESLGPDPATFAPLDLPLNELPPGGDYAQHGDGTYREVGHPGAAAGEGKEHVVRYAVEIENGVDTASIGGDDAFAAMIDATLTDPKGWTADPRFRFEHVAANDNPNMRIQLSSLDTTHKLCGNELGMETSCHHIEGTRVVLNHSRWVRGAVTFQGDLGSYRQYLVSHEVGHGIGYAQHEACGGEGQLAPVMMQQSLSLNNSDLHRIDPREVYPDDNATCKANPWPYPNPAAAKPGEKKR